MALPPVRLFAREALALGHLLGDAKRLQAGGVEIELVAGALPDHDRPRRADPVERLAVELAVPERLISPGEQPFVRGFQPRFRRLEAREIFVAAVRRLDAPARQIPVLGRNDFHRQR